MNSLKNNFFIFWALLQRDIYIIKKRIVSLWIDVAVVLFLEVTLFGSLIPLMGLPTHMIAPLFIGAAISQTFFKAVSKAFSAISDLRFSRTIDYHLTLPCSKKWLFAEQICSWVIEILVTIIPFLLIGIITLGTKFPTSNSSWLQVIILLLITACLSSILLLATAYHYDYSWYLKNIWPRRLSLLFGFCPFFYIWSQAYEFSPRIAQLILLNPFTYCIEGFRKAFLGGTEFIRLPICYSAISFFMIIFIIFLSCAIKKRLDPV